MKKITFILIAMLAFCWQSNAQFTESFETEIPASWTVINNGSVDEWIFNGAPSGGAQDGTGVASINFDTVAHDDYLITPGITVSAGTNDRISFYIRSRSGSFLEPYEVLLSTSTPDVAGLTVELQASSDAPVAWTQVSFDLSTYAGQTVYVAVHATGTDEFELYVDNVVNDAAPACTTATIDALQAIDDCAANSEYSIVVPFITEGDAIGVSDGTDTFPIVDGAAVAGPYAGGQVVTLEVVHLDSACDFSLGDLFFNCPENQDTCDTADAITPGTYTTTINAGSGGSEMGTGDDSAFFAYTPTEDGSIYVNSCDGGADTFLNIGTGTCGALVVEASNDDSCASGLGNNFASEVTIDVTAGTTYYIEWDNRYASGANEFDWTLEFTPLPECTPATIGSSDIVDNCDVDGTFSVSIVVSDPGDAGSVFDDGTTTYPVVAGMVTAGPYESGDSVTIELIAVDEACSSTIGTFDFTCPQPQDACDTAEAITPGTYTTTITQGSGGTIMGVGGDSAFFTYTPTEDGEIYVYSCFNIGVADTNLNIGTGPCNDLTTVASNDDSCDRGDGNLWASEITLAVTAGTTYVIEWDDRYTSGANEFDWTLEFTAGPVCIPATFALSNGGNTCPADNGFIVDVDITDLGSATSVNILQDGVLVWVGVDGSGSPYSVGGLTSATDYDITVEDAADDTCFATQMFSTDVCPPENDNVSGAIDLSVGDTLCESPVLGTNLGATDSGEIAPSCGSGTAYQGGDVWFKVMVPATGELTIETSAADTNTIADTLLEVYSGSAGNLTSIECDDDDGAGLYSIVELTGLTPGDVLLVRVWEFQNDNKGNFNICAWSPTTLGVDDNTFDGFTYFPNPVKDVLTLESPRTIDNIEVFNVLGQRIVAVDSQNTIQNIDLSNIQAGAYFVKVSIGDQTKNLASLF